MRIANARGRLVLVQQDAYVDVAEASSGRFGPDPQSVYAEWDAFRGWAATAELPAGTAFEPADLLAPVPAPRQVFAIGLNYHDHAAESGFVAPSAPTVFTKFVSSLAGADVTVTLPPNGHTDWEVELVAVIGRTARNVAEDRAWEYVAGLTVGQDVSERISQLAGPVPQFSLAKSFENFSPTGPWVVTVDEFADPDDLGLGCTVNGEQRQDGRTKDLVFSIPTLVSHLSSVTTLLPGDLIFTGTPAGVGMGRSPQVWLEDGDELVSTIEGIGSIRQVFVSAEKS